MLKIDPRSSTPIYEQIEAWNKGTHIKRRIEIK